jgi:cysteine desulfurase/selenocysteine lyase
LARKKNLRLHFLPVDVVSGELVWEPSGFIKFLKERTIKLVSLTHASNVLGTINPIAEIARLTHEAGAVIAVDGAQSVPHMPVNMRELDADFYAFSGHKMLGPTGIGVLWGRYQLLEKMPPFLTGGHMIEDVWLDRAVWTDPPHRFEAGTPPIAGAIGLGAAIKYLSGLGMENIRSHEKRLLEFAARRLSRIAGIKFLGPRDAEKRSGVFSFLIDGIHPHDVGSFCDERGVMIRVGDHCARPLHKKLAIPASCRASFSIYNDTDDIRRLAEALSKMVSTFNVEHRVFNKTYADALPSRHH